MHDFDNDGLNDIITHDDIFSFKFLKGMTNNTFAPEVTIFGGFGPIIDIDGDGDLDQIGLGIQQYLNNGSGSFTTQNISSAPSGQDRKFHAYSDLDQGGILDIVGSRGNTVYWYKGLQNGSYSSEKVLGTVENEVLAVKDANNDGVVDFYSMKNDKIHLHLNYINSAFRLSGQLYYDQNQNKQRDTNERTLPFLGVNISPDAGKILSIDGTFEFNADSGSHIVNFDTIPGWMLTTDSVSYTTYLSPNNDLRDSLDFGFFPSQLITNIESSLTCLLYTSPSPRDRG